MTETRMCAACGKELTRREGEKAYAFGQRRTCGGDCARALVWQGRKEKLPISPERNCALCNKLLERRSGERACNFKSRRTCNAECARALAWRERKQAVSFPVKQCAACGERMEPNPGEKRSNLIKRRSCSYECARRLTLRGVLKPEPEEKSCVECGRSFTRNITARSEESRPEYQRRTTCSMSCWTRRMQRERRERSQVLQRARIAAVGERHCVVCHTALARRPKEIANHFLKRQTCSKACHNVFSAQYTKASGARRRRPTPEKYCEMCGQQLLRQDGEPLGRFNMRKTCSVECCSQLRSQLIRMRRERSSPYPIGWNDSLRSAIRRRDDYRCAECGESERGRKHHVHHIDFNKHNLSPDNLITLCWSCHGRTTRTHNRGYYIERYKSLMEQRSRLTRREDIAA